MRFLAVLLLVGIVGCAPAPKPPVPVTRDVLVGTWRHSLPHDEFYELMLFDSGIVAFIHAGEKLPIGQAFGRWSFDEGTLDLHIVGAAGGTNAGDFPLSNRSIVMRDGSKLLLDVDGAQGSWVPADRYGSACEGADERRAQDEKGWTAQVETAEQAESSAAP